MEVAERLDAVEREVDKGDCDLKKLGFWKLVAEIKRDPELSQEFAEQVGRIERKAFERKVWFKVNLWFGHATEIAGTVLGIVLIWLGFVHTAEFMRSMSLVLASVILSASVHPLAHYAVGRLYGINFLYYFPDGPAKIEPTLKIDYASYLRAHPKHRAAMHLAGPIATVSAALVCLIVGLTADIAQWAKILLLLYFLFMLATDIFLSPKAGDIKRVKRELNAQNS
ncbi:MAG: hypothetical protein HY930_04585 [Euryarchaeota archaeon]|nr:hypothetical protein [Euryarchaeota archaeon]